MKKNENEPILTIQALSKTYKQEGRCAHALKNVSLNIYPQDIYGIIGLSGAGKSTLIRALASLIKPSSGAVLFNNTPIHDLDDQALRHYRTKIGMIFQHFNLFSSRTVAENVAYPLEIAGVSKADRSKRVDELLHLVGLSSKKQAYPSSLSGGEKQRVGIARALAYHPTLLFCDEATSALDPKTTGEILNLLKKIHRSLGVTLVLITHDMTVIKKICNKVAVLEGGRVVEQGFVAEVFAHPKHPTTEHFIQGTLHDIPKEFFKTPTPNQKLLRLRFKETSAGQPLISEIAQKFNVRANILLGWIDRLEKTTIGTLIIELMGEPSCLDQALYYLKEHHVHIEVLTKP